MVWANPTVLQKANITAEPADLDAWIADMDKLKAAGVSTPLSIAGTWTQVQLFETVLIADLGVDEYNKLFASGANWESDGVKKAVAHYAKLLSYANTASDGDDWPGATDMVIDGKAAYNVMGDWAVAQFTLKEKKDGVDYTYFPVPGSKGVFDFLADSFTLPKGAKNAAGAKDWLALIGSADGQKAFNLAKGSIPARTDVPSTDFPPYQQSAMAAFKSDKIAPSIAHGAAVSQSWNSDISSAISKFYGSKNQATLIADLVAASKKHAARPDSPGVRPVPCRTHPADLRRPDATAAHLGAWPAAGQPLDHPGRHLRLRPDRGERPDLAGADPRPDHAGNHATA